MQPTILDYYITKQKELKSQIANNSLPLDSLLFVQEINYRIYVIKTCQSFGQTAPITFDTNVMGFHYQLVDAFIRQLPNERKFGLKADENTHKQRESASQMLMTVIQDNSKRFSSFVPNTQDQYKKSINNMINTVLPAWLQYRDTYIKIEFEGRL